MSSTHQASAIRLRLLFVALGLAGPVLPAAALTEDELRYQTVGMRLTAEEAAALEAGLAEAPDELAARATLASYYMRERTKEARAAKVPHVLWIIRHHPTSPVAGLPACGLMRPLDGESYDEGRELWLEQVERHAFEPQVLGNAASYLMVSDREMARDLLLLAKEIDPAKCPSSGCVRRYPQSSPTKSPLTQQSPQAPWGPPERQHGSCRCNHRKFRDVTL